MTVKEPSPLPAHSTRAPLDDPLDDPLVAPPLPSPPSCATLPPVSCTHRMSANPSPLKSPMWARYPDSVPSCPPTLLDVAKVPSPFLTQACPCPWVRPWLSFWSQRISALPRP